MDETNAVMAMLGPGLKALREIVGLAKDAKELMPAGKDREKVERLVAEVDARIPAVEAQLAQGLGYYLCRCTWPPQIMLETGQPPRPRCGKCGRVHGLAGQLPADQEKILQLLTERSQPGFPSEEVASRIRLSEAKADYYLQDLEKRKMVIAALSRVAATRYYIHQPGRLYLVQRDLL